MARVLLVAVLAGVLPGCFIPLEGFGADEALPGPDAREMQRQVPVIPPPAVRRSGCLEGSVWSAEGIGRPLSNARVEVLPGQGSPATVLADSRGRYSWCGTRRADPNTAVLQPMRLELTARAPGYGPQAQVVVWEHDDPPAVDFRLPPQTASSF